MHHVAKLRDLAQGYQPVAGSADLAGFVDYLDSIEESDQDEDALRAVEENAVRLMTIHRAKGLEWDTVFVPGLAAKMFPTQVTPPDPAQKWQQLPTELRGDRDFVQHEDPQDEDRRLMYVAVTRAKRRLVLSRPWFFWGNKNPRNPSVFWDEVLDTGLVRVLEEAECPPENPHPESGETVPPMRPPRERVRDEEEIARIEPELERLQAVHIAVPRAARWRCPSTISVTALLTFIRDEDEFFWRYVRRAPSPPSPAAQLGIQVHRRIEEHGRGGVPLGATTDDEGRYDLDPGESRGDGPGVSTEQLWQNFLASRFAKMTPLMTEQPFTLYLGEGLSVTGRIDAIFERGDGVWEVVDYKTGATEPDPLQLAIYGRAVEEILDREAACSWLLLRDGSEVDAPVVPNLEALVSDAAKRLSGD
jgi:DNA helicase-2/ATP-dependent DNA helicase PcrA